MLPPKITQMKANWSIARNGQPIKCIIGHATDGWNSVDYLARGGNLPDGSDNGVSIPKLVNMDGSIIAYVPEERGANHVGYSVIEVGGQTYRGADCNRISLGFELENPQDRPIRDRKLTVAYSEAQLLSMGWLIFDWRTRYGHLPLYRHGDIDTHGKYDPLGLTVADMEHWVERAIATLMPVGDLWSLWGSAIPLNRSFGIPQAWYRRAKELGAAVTGEQRVGSTLVVQAFERGYVAYHDVVGVGRAYLYTELR